LDKYKIYERLNELRRQRAEKPVTMVDFIVALASLEARGLIVTEGNMCYKNEEYKNHDIISGLGRYLPDS